MLPYIREPNAWVNAPSGKIAVFNLQEDSNADSKTIDSFGDEWNRFNQFDPEDIRTSGDEYFDICTTLLKGDETVLDLGCGTGRWTAYLSSRVKFIEAV